MPAFVLGEGSPDPFLPFRSILRGPLKIFSVVSPSGEKPFQCIVCGRAFAQRCNVKRHMESHKVWPAAVAGSGTLPDIHTFEVRLAENRQLIVRPTKSIDHVMERREYRVLYGSGRGGRASGTAVGGAAEGGGGGGGGRSTEETIVLVDNCWECRFCRSRFEDFQKLRSHMRQHSDQQVRRRGFVSTAWAVSQTDWAGVAFSGVHRYKRAISELEESS